MKRFFKVGLLAGLGAAIVYYLREVVAVPDAQPVGPEAAPRFRVAPDAAAPEPSRTDDLEQIKGIGPVYRQRLAAAGVTTFAQLAGADSAELAEAVDAAPASIEDWIAQARDRA